MKLFRRTSWVATAVAMAASAASAQAQEAPTTTPAPVAAEVAAPEPAPTPAPGPEDSTLMATSAPVEEVPVDAPAEEAPAEEETAWSDNLSISMFADAYYNQDWNLPPQRALGANGTLPHTAYVNGQGFGLAFLGLDASYSLGTVGATASLRFGSAANGLIGQYRAQDPMTGAVTGNPGLENIWQAYVTWAPIDGLTLDLGQFATLYGAEVGESWLNLNYTRGALYYYMQPFWHTGLRVAYQATEQLAIKFIATNGVNTGLVTDTRWAPLGGSAGASTRAPDVGLQLAYTGDGISAYLGYYGNPIQPDQRNWSHFADLVVVGSFGDATIIFNGDLGVANFDPADSQTYFGLSLAAGYAVSEQFGVALRGEFLSAPEEYAAHFGESLITATLTLDYKPTDNLVIRLDNRLEAADAEIFATKDDTSKTYISSTLGVVVHTN